MKIVYKMKGDLVLTEDNYQVASREISEFFDHEPKTGSLDSERFEVLLTLVEAYETQHFPIELPDQVTSNQVRMQQSNPAPKVKR